MPPSETAKRTLIWLACVSVVIAARVGCLLYERNRPARMKQAVQRPTEKDYLVVIPKFGVVDLRTAQRLVGQLLWVKAGYQLEYVETFTGAAGRLSPAEKIVVEKILEKPVANQRREVRMLFEKNGKECSIGVGFFDAREDRYLLQFDDWFYPKDPRELYAHWGDQMWRKLEGHQLEKGMTVIQVATSLGYGQFVMNEAGGIQLYQFSRKPGGGPGRTRVRFLDGRVKEFEVGN